MHNSTRCRHHCDMHRAPIPPCFFPLCPAAKLPDPRSYILHPTSHILHLTSYILHPTSYIPNLRGAGIAIYAHERFFWSQPAEVLCTEIVQGLDGDGLETTLKRNIVNALTTHYLLLTIYYSLLTTQCLLPNTYYSNTYYSLPRTTYSYRGTMVASADGAWLRCSAGDGRIVEEEMGCLAG